MGDLVHRNPDTTSDIIQTFLKVEHKVSCIIKSINIPRILIMINFLVHQSEITCRIGNRGEGGGQWREAADKLKF